MLANFVFQLSFLISRPAPPSTTSLRPRPQSSPTPSRKPPPRNRSNNRPEMTSQRLNNEINEYTQNAQTAYTAYNMASSVGMAPPLIPNRPDSSSTPSIPK